MELKDISDTFGEKFLISSTDPNRLNICYLCVAASTDDHHKWIKTINNILQNQNDFLKAIQNPINYQNQNQTG